MRAFNKAVAAGLGVIVLISGCQDYSAEGERHRFSQAADSDPEAMWLADFAGMQRLKELGDAAMAAEDFDAAAAYYARASALKDNIPGPTGVYLALSAAAAYARADKPDMAVAMYKRSVDQGFRLPEVAQHYPDFASLRERDDFQAQLERTRQNATAYSNAHRDPEKARLIFDDVPRFWEAYDLAAEVTGTGRKAAIFRRHYLAPGTPGLIDYHWIKTSSMEELVERIEKSPDYYKGIRERTLGAVQYEPVIREALRRIVALYPEADAPDVTFVIGRLNSGGTAGPSGMLIGLDVWSWRQGISLEGISEGFQRVVTNLDLEALPFIVVHEHIHALQQYSGEPSLLRAAIQEGSADFIAGLTLPEREKPHYYRWGLEREQMVWRRFVDDMSGNDLSDWVGNNSTIDEEGWYADLGYFIGARICEAYYEQAEDKQQAIRDLLFVTDAGAILEASGYAQRFAE